MARRAWVLGAALVTATIATMGLVAPVLAHAELESSEPADGAIVEGSPAEVVATFSEEMDPERSQMELRDASGAILAQGGIPPDDDTATTMRIEVPQLEPGTYEVRWTSVTPDDDGIERDTFTFEVAATAATPSPSPAPTATPGGGSGGGNDLLIPLVVLAAVAVAAAVFFIRRPRSTTGP